MRLPAALLVLTLAMPALAQDNTFVNPLSERDVPDPWVVRHAGHYHLTATLDPEGGVWLWRSPTLTDWAKAEKVQLWKSPGSGPGSKGIWAPELHRFDGKWYVYFTASEGPDATHRHYVLESSGDDPMGPYTHKGEIDPELGKYAIDGSVLTLPDGRRFWMYTTGQLEIAPMPSPTKVDGSQRAVLAKPTRPWERGWVEAPEPLVRGGKVFVVYSAGHAGTPNYALGLLTWTGGDPLQESSWAKTPGPVFKPRYDEEGSIYGVGHNGFTTSPDGREDWLVYHAKEWTDPAVGGFRGRKLWAQKFGWKTDGTPDFGVPALAGQRLAKPGGE